MFRIITASLIADIEAEHGEASVTSPTYVRLLAAHAHLKDGIEEPFADLSSAERDKALRQAVRLQAAALKALHDRPLITVYRVLVYWAQSLTEANVMEVGEQSSFYRGYDLLAEILLDSPTAATLLDEVERSARKAAGHLQRWFNQRGYFCPPIRQIRQTRTEKEQTWSMKCPTQRLNSR